MKLNKDMLELDLQLFSDSREDNNPDVDESTGSDKEPNQDDNKLTQEEVNRLIAQAKSKAKEEAKKELDTDVETRIEEAVKKAKEEANLSGKELEEYKKRETEREKQELLDKIAEYELNQTRRELKDEAIKTLSNKKLPVSEQSLSLVVRDTAEDTLTAIDGLAEIINTVKNEYASDEPPKGSGGLGNSDAEINDDVFKKAKLTGF